MSTIGAASAGTGRESGSPPSSIIAAFPGCRTPCQPPNRPSHRARVSPCCRTPRRSSCRRSCCSWFSRSSRNRSCRGSADRRRCGRRHWCSSRRRCLRVRLCRCCATARCAPLNAAARRAAGRLAAAAADPGFAGMEAAWRRGTDRANPAAAHRDHRTAVLPAVDDYAAAAGVVLAALPRGRAVSPVRALEFCVAAGAARLSGAVRAVAHAAPARLDMVDAVRGVRADLCGDRLGLVARHRRQCGHRPPRAARWSPTRRRQRRRSYAGSHSRRWAR